MLVWLPAKWRERAANILRSFLSGLTVIQTFRQGLAVLVLSILHWGMMAAVVYMTSLGFAGQTFNLAGGGGKAYFTLGVAGSLLVLAFQSLAVSLPQGPGFVGTHHAAGLMAVILVLGEDSRDIGGAFAIVLWCVQILPVIVVGFICLWIQGLSIRQMRRIGRIGRTPRDRNHDSLAQADEAQT
jgi:hypothetical protein